MVEGTRLLIGRAFVAFPGFESQSHCHYINNIMFKAVKETIWHLTCTNCKNWFTYATMEEKLCIERMQLHCPHCGKKGSAKK